jgi:hypothetical protein
VQFKDLRHFFSPLIKFPLSETLIKEGARGSKSSLPKANLSNSKRAKKTSGRFLFHQGFSKEKPCHAPKQESVSQASEQ